MRSSILGIYPQAVSFTLAQLNGQFGKLTDRTEGTPAYELNGQFGKLTDRTEGAPVPKPVEGGLPKQYIYTVAHASGSESSVLFPCLIFCLFFFPCLCFCLFRVFPC